LKLKISFFFIIISSLTFGQNRELTDKDYNNSTAAKITFANPETCEEIEEWIKSDFKKKTVFLFLQGGIVPVEYTTDKDFENKYGIYFFDFACLAPDYKCVIEYNNRVFDYLTKKFGKKWMKKIRKDVIGFKEWKRKK
jgi:hypothetical protein